MNIRDDIILYTITELTVEVIEVLETFIYIVEHIAIIRLSRTSTALRHSLAGTMADENFENQFREIISINLLVSITPKTNTFQR